MTHWLFETAVWFALCGGGGLVACVVQPRLRARLGWAVVFGDYVINLLPIATGIDLSSAPGPTGHGDWRGFGLCVVAGMVVGLALQTLPFVRAQTAQVKAARDDLRANAAEQTVR